MDTKSHLLIGNELIVSVPRGEQSVTQFDLFLLNTRIILLPLFISSHRHDASVVVPVLFIFDVDNGTTSLKSTNFTIYQGEYANAYGVSGAEIGRIWWSGNTKENPGHNTTPNTRVTFIKSRTTRRRQNLERNRNQQ